MVAPFLRFQNVCPAKELSESVLPAPRVMEPVITIPRSTVILDGVAAGPITASVAASNGISPSQCETSSQSPPSPVQVETPARDCRANNVVGAASAANVRARPFGRLIGAEVIVISGLKIGLQFYRLHSPDSGVRFTIISARVSNTASTRPPYSVCGNSRLITILMPLKDA